MAQGKGGLVLAAAYTGASLTRTGALIKGIESQQIGGGSDERG